MKRCPICKNFSVAFDPSRKAYRCMVAGCSCVVIDEHSYSYLKPDPSSRSISRVKVERGRETKVIKKYSMA